jgi:hypothetical protein
MCACPSAKAGAQEYSAVSAAWEHDRKPLRHRRDRSDHEFVGLERRIKDAVREEVIKLGVV